MPGANRDRATPAYCISGTVVQSQAVHTSLQIVLPSSSVLQSYLVAVHLQTVTVARLVPSSVEVGLLNTTRSGLTWKTREPGSMGSDSNRRVSSWVV